MLKEALKLLSRLVTQTGPAIIGLKPISIGGVTEMHSHLDFWISSFIFVLLCSFGRPCNRLVF